MLLSEPLKKQCDLALFQIICSTLHHRGQVTIKQLFSIFQLPLLISMQAGILTVVQWSVKTMRHHTGTIVTEALLMTQDEYTSTMVRRY